MGRHSGQGSEASELDGNRQECVFCFCSPCVTCVRQQWLCHGQDAYKKNSGIRKKLYREFWSKMNMRGAWRHPLYVHKKETAMCRAHGDGTVVLVLREIMPECVLKLEGSVRIHPPLHTQLSGAEGRRRLLVRSKLLCVCISRACSWYVRE